MDIQTEIQNIHHQFGVSEKANYEIQKLFDKAMNEEKQEIDWNKLRDKFFRECTDPSPDSGRNAGIRPININSHNLFEWFRNEILLQ